MKKLTKNLILVRSEIRRRLHDGITTISWVGGNKDIVADSQFLSFGFNYDFSKKKQKSKKSKPNFNERNCTYVNSTRIKVRKNYDKYNALVKLLPIKCMTLP